MLVHFFFYGPKENGENSVNPYAVILIEGLSYIVVFGGLIWLRREGLSRQFVVEGLAITTICVAIGLLTGYTIAPVPFLTLIYLVTLRARLLVEVGNFLLARRRQDAAISLYHLAMKLRPDLTSRAIVLINEGLAHLFRGEPKRAISSLRTALEAKLSPKYESACRYGLGLAHHRAGEEAEAVRQLKEAIEVCPNSIYARQAQRALETGEKANAE